jgi:ribosomal protein S18 acetylase RimI-like enzyme
MGLDATVREVTSVQDVVALSGDDAMCTWAAGGGRERFGWVTDGALGVLGTDLSERDRLIVRGQPEAVSALADRVFAERHPGVRVTGDAELISELGRIRPDLAVSEVYGWMQVSSGGLRLPAASRWDNAVAWLPPEDDTEVAALVAANFPDSHAKPCAFGVRRWAGIRAAGQLVAVACEAWSAPRCGFMAGVTTAQAWRGRGLARAVCARVLDQLSREHGQVGLLADTGNPAVRLYQELGLTWRSIRSARPSGQPPVTG